MKIISFVKKIFQLSMGSNNFKTAKESKNMHQNKVFNKTKIKAVTPIRALTTKFCL